MIKLEMSELFLLHFSRCLVSIIEGVEILIIRQFELFTELCIGERAGFPSGYNNNIPLFLIKRERCTIKRYNSQVIYVLKKSKILGRIACFWGAEFVFLKGAFSPVFFDLIPTVWTIAAWTFIKTALAGPNIHIRDFKCIRKPQTSQRTLCRKNHMEFVCEHTALCSYFVVGCFVMRNKNP